MASGSIRLPQAHQTSAPYAKNVSEFSACGFDAEWRIGTDAPYVKSSPLQVGCRLREHQALNINGTHLLIGEVTALYCAADAQRDDGSLDLAKLDLATVSGLDTYSEPGKSRRFDLARVDTPPAGAMTRTKAVISGWFSDFP